MVSRRPSTAQVLTLGLVVTLAGCGGEPAAAPPPLRGVPSTPEYVGVQDTDLPEGMVRCQYSGPMDAYLESLKQLGGKGFESISGTWAQLQAAGAAEGYVTVYADTVRACEVWVAGSTGGPVLGGSRIVSAVVVRFVDVPAAEAGFMADIFKQSQLKSRPGLRALSGAATRLGPNSAIGAEEASNPTIHQAVWQNGAFNVFFTSRNLTRAEFEAAVAAEHRRAA